MGNALSILECGKLRSIKRSTSMDKGTLCAKPQTQGSDTSQYRSLVSNSYCQIRISGQNRVDKI